jgi:hypothetical protein
MAMALLHGLPLLEPFDEASARVTDQTRRKSDERWAVVFDAADLEPLLADAEQFGNLPRAQHVIGARQPLDFDGGKQLTGAAVKVVAYRTFEFTPHCGSPGYGSANQPKNTKGRSALIVER